MVATGYVSGSVHVRHVWFALTSVTGGAFSGHVIPNVFSHESLISFAVKSDRLVDAKTTTPLLAFNFTDDDPRACARAA